MPELIAYLNGRFLSAKDAFLSLDDLGFVWGATVTDRLRTFRQQLFRFDDHVRRFRSSCIEALIPQPLTDRELAEIAHELIERNAQANPGCEWSLVLFATPGKPQGKPTLGMQARPLDFSKYAGIVIEGANLEAVPFSSDLPPRIKHRSRLGWWMASRQVTAGFDPLFTSGPPEDFVRETPIANIVAVIDGSLVSPPRSTILNGISLQVVEEIACSLSIPFEQRELPLTEVLSNASEVLLTNTSFCIAPVSRIVAPAAKPQGFSDTRYPIPDTPSPVFHRLLNAWSDLVEIDILHQFHTNR